MLGLALTILKPFNAGLVVWLVLSGNNYCAAGAIIWLMLCDIFDGYFFRRSHLAPNKRLRWFRRVFDVTGDHLAIETVLIIMVIRLDFPITWYATEVARQLMLLAIWLYGYQMKRPLREPNLSSRISNLSVGLMAVGWLTFPAATGWLLIPMIGFGLPGLYQYYRTIKFDI